jgi:Acetyltransferase (GNAT) domain
VAALSGLVLERIRDMSSADWESFLDGPTDGTLFHRLSFLAYHPPERFRTHFLFAHRKGRPAAVIPLAEADGEAAGGLGSPYGGTFGGWAALPSVGVAGHVELLDALAAYAKGAGFHSLWISSRPAPYRVHGEGAEHALALRGARVVRRDVTQIADLRGDDAAAAGGIAGAARRGARKAERLGTTVVRGDAADLPAFHAILREDRARLGVVPTHTLPELERLWAARPDDYVLLLARNAGQPVGGVLLFRASPGVALSFYAARADVPTSERCMNLLTERSIRESREWGCDFLDYGTSSIDGELNPGLASFKESFGGKPYLRETWRLALL